MMKMTTVMLLSLALGACSKNRPVQRVDAPLQEDRRAPEEPNNRDEPVTEAEAAIEGEPTAEGAFEPVEPPEVLQGQFLRGTVELRRFNPTRVENFVAAAPVVTKAHVDSELGRLLYLLTFERKALDDPGDALPSLRQSGDVWLMLALPPDGPLDRWIQKGDPFLAGSYAGEPLLRVFFPSAKPGNLKTELETICAQERPKRCPGLLEMKVVGKSHLRVDATIPMSGVVKSESRPDTTGVEVTQIGDPTPALHAFFANDLAFARWQQTAGSRAAELALRLGAALGARPGGQRARVGKSTPSWEIPYDEYLDATVRLFEDDTGAHADLHHTYTATGRALARRLRADVELPSVEVEDPIFDFEWAADFDAHTDALPPRKMGDMVGDVLEDEDAWLAAPVWAASRSFIGPRVFDFRLPFFTDSGLLAIRIVLGRTTAESGTKAVGAVLFLTDDFTDDAETKRNFRGYVRDFAKKFGRPDAEEVRKLDGRLLHVFTFGEEDPLGPLTPVSQDARGAIDLQRATAQRFGIRVATKGDQKGRRVLTLNRVSHDTGATLQVSYGTGEQPELTWSEVPVPPDGSACERRAVNRSHQAYIAYRALRTDAARGLAHIQEQVEWFGRHDCGEVSERLLAGWTELESLHESGQVPSVRYGIEALCNLETVCEVPDNVASNRAARWLAGCLVRKYPGSEASEMLSYSEKMTPEQSRKYFGRKAQEAGLDSCPVIEVFWPKK